MSNNFDLIVIGSGSAAGSVASRCRAAGWTVAMIDKQPFGGTCALRGCDPKKVLVGAAAALDAARGLAVKGARSEGLTIDWAELMRFKRTFTDPYPEKKEAGLLRAGIDIFHGPARFVGASRVAVGDVVLEAARAIVIAAGAHPADLPVPGHEYLLTSDQFLELPALPSALAFVGGGYISFEFAHVAARAGARVTIMHRGARPLAGFDPEMYIVAPMMGLHMDIGGPMLGHNWMAGMMMHVVNGAVIFPLIYVYLLYAWLPSGPMVKGTICCTAASWARSRARPKRDRSAPSHDWMSLRARHGSMVCRIQHDRGFAWRFVRWIGAA